MFLKLLGSCLLIAVGGMVGLRMGESRAAQAKTLERLALFLGALSDALYYQRGTTAELLESAAREYTLPFLQKPLPEGPGFPELLSRELEAARHRLPRTGDPEWRLFDQAVLALCRQDAPQARRTLEHAQKRLSQAAEAALREAATQKKLCRTLGISLGAAAALLLL